MLNWLSTFFILLTLPAVAQQSARQTYAVVVGISTYASKGIPSLRFANKDAEAFAQYLREDPAVKIPAENLRLLLNEEATTASVYSALSWLNEVAAKDDLIYFYFSGHGDMESETIYKLGFLLAHNTPRTNYINNAIRIEDINNFANTLSTKNEAKVVIITDACHSGNLAGSEFRGNGLVGKSLSISEANEIRIASCRPDQLSMEDEGWGGGRGVFSFHLINGMVGFAAKKGRAAITLKDLRRFMDSSLAKDKILQRENHVQNAVIDGPDAFPISKADPVKVERIRKEGLNMPAASALPEEQAAETIDIALDKFGTWLKKQKLDSGYNYSQLQQLDASEVASAWLQMCKKNVSLASAHAEENTALQKVISRLGIIQKAVASDSTVRKEFDRLLVVAIHDHAQQVANAYLEGDAAELERRRYYNAGSAGYEVYVDMYNVALKLISPDDYLHRIFNVNRYYFAGLAKLLKIPLTEDREPLIKEGIAYVTEAVNLEKQAPYIYNLLGVLEYYNSNFKTSEHMYLKALELAPKWSIPYNNLLALYLAENNLLLADSIFTIAQEYGRELADFNANAGLLWEIKHDFLKAEEFQRKSIFINSRHYLPYERLANIYTTTTDYALADSFYFEADVRKRGYHFKKFFQHREPAPAGLVLSPELPCNFDSTKVDSKNVVGMFALGIHYYKNGNIDAATIKLNKVIQLDPRHPVAFYYLAKFLFDQKNSPAADVMFRIALDNHLTQDAAMAYQDSLLRVSKYKVECFRGQFFNSWFPKENLHAFLGTLYREWNYFTDAEIHFRHLVNLMPNDFSANKVLWSMLEQIGKYQDAESLIKIFRQKDPERAERELNGFYKRMILLYPNQNEWYLKAGLFLYELVKKYPADFEEDKKRIFPDQKVPETVLLPIVVEYSEANPETLPGTFETMHYEPRIIRPYSDAILYLTYADSLTGNNLALTADINDKLGDLYSWQGVPLYAARHYQASIDASRTNAGVRKKLISAYHETFQFSEAITHLEFLQEDVELDFENLLLFSDYLIRQSKFEAAENLLIKAKAIYPFTHLTIVRLAAKKALLQNKTGDAIKSYESVLKKDPSDSLAMYSLSRMYALEKDNAKAIFWLKKAYDKGFHYKWVLKNDPLMASLRKTREWHSFITEKKFIEYPEPSNTLPRATE